METKHFNSSNIKSATFDPDTNRMTVEFTHGRLYPPIYGVTKNQWREFVNAPSAGGYFNANFRK